MEGGVREKRDSQSTRCSPGWAGLAVRRAPIDSELMANGRQKFFQMFIRWKLKSCATRMFCGGQHAGERFLTTLQLPLTSAQNKSNYSYMITFIKLGISTVTTIIATTSVFYRVHHSFFSKRVREQ